MGLLSFFRSRVLKKRFAVTQHRSALSGEPIAPLHDITRNLY